MKRAYKNILLNPTLKGAPFSFPLFEGKKPVVEIGFGNGEFLMHLGKAYPENPVVGIELSLTCIHKALKRIRHLDIPNVYLLHGDVRFLLGEYFPNAGVMHIYMNYPCPWPKHKHAKRRVTTSRFVDVLAGVLEKGGRFSFVSDEPWYAEEVHRCLGTHEALSSAPVVTKLPDHLETKYGRKWRSLGKNSYMVEVSKVSSWSHQRQSSREGEMHKKLKGNLCSDYPAMVQAFRGVSEGDGGNGWILREFFQGEAGEFLVMVISYDEDYQQRFYLRLIPCKEGGALLRFDPTAAPCRTPSVLAAFEGVARLFEDFSKKRETFCET